MLLAIAKIEHKVVGAVWVRIMNDYGHVDEQTPSFAISVVKEYRHMGIGTAMMKHMLHSLAQKDICRHHWRFKKQGNYASKDVSERWIRNC